MRLVTLLAIAYVATATLISSPTRAEQDASWGMDASIPLVWSDQPTSNAQNAFRVARVGSFVRLVHTKTPRYEGFTIYAPGCAIHYMGAPGTKVLLEVQNLTLSRRDPEVPLISLIGSTTRDAEMRFKTGARNDLARVIQKMSGFEALAPLQLVAQFTPRAMKWQDAGYRGEMRVWEGRLVDMVEDFATVDYAISPTLESYTISTSACAVTYAGPKQTMTALHIQDGRDRLISADRTRGPETAFLVTTPTPTPKTPGVQVLKRRMPGESSESMWLSQKLVPLDIDVGEFSPGSRSRRSVIAATPYALVNRDRAGGDDTLNLNTPSCSVLQGRFGNDIWVQVYDAASDAFAKVLRKDLGRGEHNVAVDTRSSGVGTGSSQGPSVADIPAKGVLH